MQGACKKCLEVHEEHSFCKPNYLGKSQYCEDENVPKHRYYLYLNAKRKGSGSQKKSRSCSKGDKGRKDYTFKIKSVVLQEASTRLCTAMQKCVLKYCNKSLQCDQRNTKFTSTRWVARVCNYDAS